MIPDTFGGGLILSLINMSVVFLVLGILALIIQLTHRILKSTGAVSKDQKERKETEARLDAVPEEDRVPLESLESPVKAAIAAALAVYLGAPAASVFVRRIPDSGAWGKSSRAGFNQMMLSRAHHRR
ncbi:MAG TPA: OadG family protein [Firmicutes bacterium]|nr:OadG family protein [Candidatus Fermentithermobacillaceae bacterium]